MKIALKHIKPNPWRHINRGYLIDKAKVEKLRSSIKRTGFWDNLVARKANENGYVEIAYGHHRIEALRHDFKPDHEINVVVRDLDDAMMLKIMAEENENMDLMSPAVINETVKATLDFLKANPKELEALLPPKGEQKAHNRQVMVPAIAKFLNWNVRRIEEAIHALNAFESGELDKKEYEAIPFQRSAEVYRTEIKKHPLPKEKRDEIVEQLKSGKIGAKQVKHAILDAKYPQKKEKRELEISDVSDKVTQKLLEASVLMTPEFIKNADAVSGKSFHRLSVAVNGLIRKLKQVNNHLKQGPLQITNRR